MLRRLAIACISIALTGCFTAGKRGGDTALMIYDLGTVPVKTPDIQRAIPVAIEVRAPLWFDSLGIQYRLGYNDPARLREYTLARWAGPPSQLVQLRLARELGLTPAGQSRAVCLLRLDIEEFSQVFDDREKSRGVMQARVQWLDRTRRPLAEQRFSLEMPASSANAGGGVAALTAAVAALSSNLASWERTLATSGKLGLCQS